MCGVKITLEISRCKSDPNTPPLKSFSGFPPHLLQNVQSSSLSRLGRPRLIWSQLCNIPLYFLLASMFFFMCLIQSCSYLQCFSSYKSQNMFPSSRSNVSPQSPFLKEQYFLFLLPLRFFLCDFTFPSDCSSQLTLYHKFMFCLMKGRNFVYCSNLAPIRVLAQKKKALNKYYWMTNNPLGFFYIVKDNIEDFCLYHLVQ